MTKHLRNKRIVIVILLLIIFVLLYYLCVVSDIIAIMCAEEVKAIVINMVNDSNDIIIGQSFFYSDYFEIQKDNDGKITAFVSNNGLINQMNMILQTEIQNRINELRSINLSLPAGAFTGSSILAQFGFLVPLRVHTVSNCYTELTSEFSAVGINQTIHRLKITAKVEIKVLIPTRSVATDVFDDVVLAENLIIGEVPDTYMGENFDSNYLDLLP